MTTVTIPTWRSAAVQTSTIMGNTPTVQGFVSDDVPGLAITPFQSKLGQTSDRWVVTHLESGTSIGGYSFATFDIAQAAALGIRDLADWTAPAEGLRAMTAKKRRALQAAINRVMKDV